MASSAFNPDPNNLPPISIEQLRASDVGSTSAIAITAANGGSYTAAAAHFSGTSDVPTTILPAVAGKSIVLYSCNTSTSNTGAFAGVLFPTAATAAARLNLLYDIWSFACNLQGPMFMDFSQPVVLPVNTSLAMYTFAQPAGAVNLVSVRYSYHSVAGAATV